MSKRRLQPGTFATVPLLSVKGQDPYVQIVYSWLFQHANQTNVCWPSIATLMECCGIKSRSKMKECLRELERLELVKCSEREYSSNLYEVFYNDEGGRNTATPPAAIRPTPGRNTATELEPLELKPINTESLSEIPAKAVSYGNPEIGSLLEDIKNECEKNGWAYEKDMEREFARHILTAKDFRASAEKVNMDPHQYALVILQASSALDFWAGKITGPKSIYKRHAQIYNAVKTAKQKQKPQFTFL